MVISDKWELSSTLVFNTQIVKGDGSCIILEKCWVQ